MSTKSICIINFSFQYEKGASGEQGHAWGLRCGRCLSPSPIIFGGDSFTNPW